MRTLKTDIHSSVSALGGYTKRKAVPLSVNAPRVGRCGSDGAGRNVRPLSEFSCHVMSTANALSDNGAASADVVVATLKGPSSCRFEDIAPLRMLSAPPRRSHCP
eukprot:9185840-Lingulodinium_polyedra.AAC.1